MKKKRLTPPRPTASGVGRLKAYRWLILIPSCTTLNESLQTLNDPEIYEFTDTTGLGLFKDIARPQAWYAAGKMLEEVLDFLTKDYSWRISKLCL